MYNPMLLAHPIGLSPLDFGPSIEPTDGEVSRHTSRPGSLAWASPPRLRFLRVRPEEPPFFPQSIFNTEEHRIFHLSTTSFKARHTLLGETQICCGRVVTKPQVPTGTRQGLRPVGSPLYRAQGERVAWARRRTDPALGCACLERLTR